MQHLTTALALIGLLGIGCGGKTGHPEEIACPEGWILDTAGAQCRATDEFVKELERQHGSGVYGLTRAIQGNCMPCSGTCEPSCNSTLAAGLTITAYRDADVTSIGGTSNACGLHPFKLALSAAAAGSTLVESDGVYRLPLQPGRYALTAIDPIDHCSFLAGQAEVAGGAFTFVHFTFDHGAY